jgi:hypothetical protein
MAQQIAVEIGELYHCVEYAKYLLAGSVALAMYVAVMLFLVGFGVAALAVALPCSSARFNSGRARMRKNALDKPLSSERLSDKMRINRDHKR